jgi:DNA-directed RNA polymerase specialized sigma24 family protein
MKDNPYLEPKAALTPAEKLRVAVAVLIEGFDQHRVAALMGVNLGRVNEAVTAVRQAIDPQNEAGWP